MSLWDYGNNVFEKPHTCSSGGSGGGEGECLGVGNSCSSDSECCNGNCASGTCEPTLDPGNCGGGTPVLRDVLGNGLSLTDAVGGVNFDLDTNRVAERISWTKDATDDAWLSLDMNGNGVIENGMELFGNLATMTQFFRRCVSGVDAHGNRFRYRAKVKDSRDAQLGRWSWDVFLVSQP